MRNKSEKLVTWRNTSGLFSICLISGLRSITLKYYITPDKREYSKLVI